MTAVFMTAASEAATLLEVDPFRVSETAQRYRLEVIAAEFAPVCNAQSFSCG